MSTGPASVNPSTVAPYMFSLMLRNIATYGFQIADHNEPGNPGGYTAPGCVLASPSWPSYPGNVAPIIEDYVFNWTRDAAITMSAVLNQAPAEIPAAGASDLLASYVNFASTCQASGGDIGQAHYTPQGASTGSADESDGPALRILTILQGFAGLDGPTQMVAGNVIAADLAYLLDNNRYQNPTWNLWEDTFGQSIFARSVQLAALNRVINLGPGLGIPVPPTAQAAATWLEQQLPLHWSGAPGNYYVGVLDASRGGGDPSAPYDPTRHVGRVQARPGDATRLHPVEHGGSVMPQGRDHGGRSVRAGGGEFGCGARCMAFGATFGGENAPAVRRIARVFEELARPKITQQRSHFTWVEHGVRRARRGHARCVVPHRGGDLG